MAKGSWVGAGPDRARPQPSGQLIQPQPAPGPWQRHCGVRRRPVMRQPGGCSAKPSVATTSAEPGRGLAPPVSQSSERGHAGNPEAIKDQPPKTSVAPARSATTTGAPRTEEVQTPRVTPAGEDTKVRTIAERIRRSGTTWSSGPARQHTRQSLGHRTPPTSVHQHGVPGLIQHSAREVIPRRLR